MNEEYVPKQGDIVVIKPPPAAEGREQAKGRPWLVVSSQPYNEKIGLMLAVPLTTVVKGYPFEVAIAGTKQATGVALADQVQCLDWRARNARRIDQAHPTVVATVGALIGVMVKVRTGG
ncbi:MAG TPA: type II toxin-antitoxin system PemK/MazF family toxin [Gammaproteobacteria bacterium]|nr:type II toxin-antitoxin system PemK/MazF family toxin [Gammaproteobacteria bacterium]